MDRLRRTFSFRKRKKPKRGEVIDIPKPQQWLDDEIKIKEGFCSFQVKYLGNIEVYESRGMQVCEEAIKALRKSKKKPQKAILYVSGDALRVSDDISQHLIVDQTIEKVSFCAPDRNHDKGFAYICRDGATRRWMCHAFLAVKESGERLSHAVGCAFAICLEKKQKRERDAIQLATTNDRPSFNRIGSFRPATLAERLLDPQSTVVTTSLQVCSEHTTVSNSVGLNPASPVGQLGAIPRPHASPSIIERQGSLRIFPKLQENSPFKRDLSLRLEELPSTLRRPTKIINGDTIPEETFLESDSSLFGSTALPVTHQTNGHYVKSDTKVSDSFQAMWLQSTSGSPSNTDDTNTIINNNDNNNNKSKLTHIPSTNLSPFKSANITMPQSVIASNNDVNSFNFGAPFTDPFSAAPVNHATIQQHHQIELQQQQQTRQPLLSPQLKNAAVVLSSNSAPNSPFISTGSPKIAPILTSLNPIQWNTDTQTARAPHVKLQYSSSSTDSMTGTNSLVPTLYMQTQFVHSDLINTNHALAGQIQSQLKPQQQTGFRPVSFLPNFNSAVNPFSSTSVTTITWSENSSSAIPSLLPPEPDRPSDPFDLGWVDRATAITGSIAMDQRNIGNPFTDCTQKSP